MGFRLIIFAMETNACARSSDVPFWVQENSNFRSPNAPILPTASKISVRTASSVSESICWRMRPVDALGVCPIAKADAPLTEGDGWRNCDSINPMRVGLCILPIERTAADTKSDECFAFTKMADHDERSIRLALSSDAICDKISASLSAAALSLAVQTRDKKRTRAQDSLILVPSTATPAM